MTSNGFSEEFYHMFLMMCEVIKLETLIDKYTLYISLGSIVPICLVLLIYLVVLRYVHWYWRKLSSRLHISAWSLPAKQIWTLHSFICVRQLLYQTFGTLYTDSCSVWFRECSSKTQAYTVLGIRMSELVTWVLWWLEWNGKVFFLADLRCHFVIRWILFILRECVGCSHVVL